MHYVIINGLTSQTELTFGVKKNFNIEKISFLNLRIGDFMTQNKNLRLWKNELEPFFGISQGL